MNIEKNIRAQARNALSGGWVTVIAAFFLLSMLIYLSNCVIMSFSNFTNIFTDDGKIKSGADVTFTIISCSAVLILVLLSPFKNGFYKICYQLSNGEKADFGEMFYFFKGNKYFTTLQFNLILALRIIVNLLIGLIPYFLLNLTVYLFSLQLLTTVAANEIIEIIRVILVVLAIVFAVFRSSALYITEFLFIEYDGECSSRLFKMSRAITKRHGKDLRRLFVSFLPWIALCFFALPAIYVFPYITTAFATSSKWLIKLYKEGTQI